METGTSGKSGIDWRITAALMAAAAVVYSAHLRSPFDSSEAYTVLAASQSHPLAVTRVAMRYDPGKPPLYPLLLHFISSWPGGSELSLRLPSVISSLLTLPLIIVLGAETFVPSVGLAAAGIWAFNLMTVTFAAWARNYALLGMLTTAQFLLLWRLRTHPKRSSVLACGILGGAVLYTHLCGVLFLAAESAMLTRESWRGQSRRGAWAAMFISAILFLPFLPIASSQIRELIAGHWVDWIGTAGPSSIPRQAAVLLVLSIISAVLVLGPPWEKDEREPLRWCLAVALFPMLLLVAGSIAVRPMFAPRYLWPSLIVLTLVAARLLASLSVSHFRLAVTAIIGLQAFLCPAYARYVPWQDIARTISEGSPNEPVFFEPLFTDSRNPLADNGQGFPLGFLRVPFDHYFAGPNPRLVVDPSKPVEARRTIAQAALRANGAWLVTAYERLARVELPRTCFRTEERIQSQDGSLIHVIPLPEDSCRPASDPPAPDLMVKFHQYASPR